MSEEYVEDLQNVPEVVRLCLSSITQLNVKLTGVAPQGYIENAVSPFTEVIVIIGPLCGPLTHIMLHSRIIEVVTGGIVSFDPVVEAVSKVSSSSLSHLTFDVMQTLIPQFASNHSDDHTDDDIDECFIDLGHPASASLASLTSLVHLDLSGGYVSDAMTWAALPSSVTSLRLGFLTNVPKGFLLPCMEVLVLQKSNCRDLRQLLEATPESVHLSLKRLMTPEEVSQQEDLEFIIRHPAWCRANSGGPNCSPVTHLDMGTMFALQKHEPGYLTSWKMLSLLPTMPSISNFTCTYHECSEHLGMVVIKPQARLLHLISASLPNLTALKVSGLQSFDSDLTGLHACKFLRVLKLSSSKFVTGSSMLLLAAALPQLVTFQVSGCVLVSGSDQQELAELLAERVSAHLCDT